MSEEHQFPKVVCIKTGRAYVAEPETPTITSSKPEPEPFRPNEYDVHLLSQVADDLRAGRVEGIVVLAGVREEDGSVNHVAAYTSDPVYERPQLFIGAIETEKFDLLHLAEDMWEDEDE